MAHQMAMSTESFPQHSSSPVTSGHRMSEDVQVLEMSPATTPAQGDHKMRMRAKSRSTSVPSALHLNLTPATNTDNLSRPAITSPLPAATRHSTSTVKHLTCFWWKEKGACRFSDDNCLYAHYDTGHYTEPPRQLIPGEPALAGRKLDRAMRSLAIAHRSSGSLGSLPTSQHGGSRPTTPIYDHHNSPLFTRHSPAPIFPHSANANPAAAAATAAAAAAATAAADLAQLNNDNAFLRTLVGQNGKEKAVLISTIEELQADKKGMQGELEGLRKAQEQLLVERENLHTRLRRMEQVSASASLPPLPVSMRNVTHTYGAIGHPRVSTEAKYLGGLFTDD